MSGGQSSRSLAPANQRRFVFLRVHGGRSLVELEISEGGANHVIAMILSCAIAIAASRVLRM